ncbi:MAG TPA: recombinase family protein [Reyranella sp.]|nr:recombinase family protein [Reyranella sp.]
MLRSSTSSARGKRPWTGSPAERRRGLRAPACAGASWRHLSRLRREALRRPELAKVLETARKGKATLLIAKLDRLARNVALIRGREVGIRCPVPWR